ncbi:MAG: alpha-L-fucosidase, partial [bacterium]|nr:alpha-L-fucosidase [bacterium]
MHRKTTLRTTVVLLLACLLLPAANDPERVEWFRDLGLGLFIHWSLDSQVTSVISHSMAGADEAYLKRYVEELPRSFNPKKFDPREWARLARLAGFKYVVLTTKHHSGFCMYDTKTTNFNIMNTPYGRDITRELFDAFRAEGLAIGHYFSPDDFHFLYRQGTLISRLRPEALVSNNQELHELDKAQMREMMRNYGTIDMVFFDPPTNVGRNTIVGEMKKIVWEENPKALVTRGEMETPEQYTPGVPLEGAWEGNLTMGGQWQYRGT